MADPGSRPPARPRSDTPEAVELRAIKASHPDLGDAVDMHLELIELQRRLLPRIPTPWFELNTEVLLSHQREGRPILKFESIPLELSDLRLIVRQTADVLRRHGAIENADFEKVQSLGRDMALLGVASDWYRAVADRHVAAVGIAGGEAGVRIDPSIDSVMSLAMRPFLSRCAEVLQQRTDLDIWTHPHCPLCGGEPDFSVITPAAERHLICGRCSLRWKFEPLTCPYCLNADRARITSFATPDGKYRVYACDVCQRYLKAYDGRRSTRPVMPVVDGVATLPLDAAAMQRGYSS